MNLIFKIENKDLYINFKGNELTFTTLPEIRKDIFDYLEDYKENYCNIYLDVKEIKKLDSSGIGLFISIKRFLMETICKEADIYLINKSSYIGKTMYLLGVSNFFK